ncbi:hypothetical protein [Alkaliphilus hydrothermalis]|uniref:Uncharacterized protein n=1 Tax=Alkaliphilus hydrothermalis TaxID=1482730 RepID=A0ABS2NP31_9FIRM|nr:hypothetical protein [Alkaliphilus hydrothermalis]MBM7614616.1 hypothetical protein [Alkaliphilus hydrothermalis]
MMLLNSFDKGFKSRRRKSQEEKEELKQLLGKTDFENGDFLALIIAALVTLVPVVLIMLLIYYGVSMYFFG